LIVEGLNIYDAAGIKKLREIHLYLGCLFAPVLIFFAVTGAWQLFSLNHGRKDNSYVPPKIIVRLSEIHQYQHIPPPDSFDRFTPIKYFFLAATIGLVASSILGVVMAFRFGRSRASVVSCLVAGVVVPTAILLIYH
jgi:hypothetical protein